MAANEASGSSLRFRNGLPADATQEDKKEFALYALNNYRAQEWNGSSLSEYFAEDFASFSIDDFATVDSDTRRNLRDLLRKRGVFVPKGRNIQISVSLHSVVQNDLPWPVEDEERPVVAAVLDHNDNPDVIRSAQLSNPSRDENRQESLPETTDAILDNGKTPEDNSGKTWRRGSMANLFKAYGGEHDKFSGSTVDNFDRKFMLFVERCDQADIPAEDRHRAFSMMLTGHARQFYFDSVKKKNLDLDGLVSEIKSRFITPEKTRALLREWEGLNLKDVIISKPGHSSSACLEFMIERLTDIQSSLPQEYQHEIILRNKILNGVKDVDACRLAYHKPAETVQGVISDLHASLATMDTQNRVLGTQLQPAAHFVDRRVVRGNSNRQGHEEKATKVSHGKKCFVCGRPGCWSSNHPPKERLQAYRKNKSIRQYFATLRDEESSEEEDVNVADAVEDVIAHFIDINHDDSQTGTSSPSNAEEEESFSHLATLRDEEGPASFTARLQNVAFTHSISDTVRKFRFSTKFEGLMIDTGAARGSTSGSVQYKAYCDFIGKSPSVDDSRAAMCHFGIGSARSRGVASIEFPVGELWFTIEAHIVDADTPILLAIDDMDRLGIYFNNLENTVIHTSSGQRGLVSRVRGHPFIQWNPHISCLLTEVELRRLHRRFGHPSTDKLMKLLKRSTLENIGSGTRRILEAIEKHCDPCQRYAQKPRRFKFTLRDDKDFNHTVYVDIFYIESKPVLHVVDEATNFQAAKWLENMSSEALWRALRMCWIDVYLGPPDIVAHDAGKNFMGAAFQANTDMLHIRTKAVPVESANSMTVVERYHAPLRKAFHIIRKEAPDMEKEEVLQMAVKAINDSVGPEGLVPTLLVFGALPRLGLPTDAPTPSTFQRATALRKATAEMSRHFASRQIKDALATRNGPDVSDIHTAPIGSAVLVYRPSKDMWEGPYSLLDIQGEDIIVLTPKGPQKFRSTVVKRYVSPSNSSVLAPDPGQSNLAPSSNMYRGRSASLPAINTSNMVDSRFAQSRMAEFNSLMNRGVFSIVPTTETGTSRVYGSRFVDTIKFAGKPQAHEKSRLVVQAYNDNNHGLLTHAPTVQRLSQRLLLCLCAIESSLTFFTRDVSQAYVQAETSTQRAIFVRPPSTLNLPSDTVLRVNRPLYGIPEAGLHWFQTYHKHHRERLCLTPSIHDPCFLYTNFGMSSDNKRQPKISGFTCLQTDDTASAGNNAFMVNESKMSKRFDCKPAQTLSEGGTITFNGADIGLVNGIYYMSQNEHINRLANINEEIVDKSEFVTQRARGAYIASVARPDLSFGFAQASQVIEPDKTAAIKMNKHIARSKANADIQLKFVPVDQKSLRLAVFSDASFASNQDLSSQLGYIIAIADNHGNANIIHYQSIKSKRVTKSVLASELFAAVHAFDVASTLRVTLNNIFDRSIPLVLYTDSKSLFDSIVGMNSTTEKRLLIDLSLLRERYELRELTEVVWIPSEENPADALTKENASPALMSLLQKNKISVNAKVWVDRPTKYSQKRKTREDPRSHRSA